MIISRDLEVVVEKMRRKSDKTYEIYSVRNCPKATEVTVVGEDDKGRKFCRVFSCQNTMRID